MIRAALLAAALAAPGGAAAQPAPETDPGPYMELLRGCLSGAATPDEDAACKGLVFEECGHRAPEGTRDTTIGMTLCLLTEQRAWDVLLNEVWKRLRASMAAADADDGGARAETLLRAQRAWIAFRDAECAWQHAIWGLGSMRQIAGADCMAGRTADRVIDFRSELRQGDER
ncbi:lysozyme inhibitor LprI family protein [Rhodovulum sp. DZ06]|uniref:lysozyme inhibitor LprI family protein n=1 Tax=Rhodovulum sp. DZ06 TaxID=3425126 RepID=UPI003D342490